MTIFTHNQILKALSDFVASHGQLKTFGTGEVSEVAEMEAVKYPMMWTIIQPGLFEQNTIGYIYDILFMDIVRSDIVNQDEIYSDCILYAADLIAHLTNLSNTGDNFFFSVGQTAFEPFEDSFKDAVAGVKISITLRTAGYQDNSCKIP